MATYYHYPSLLGNQITGPQIDSTWWMGIIQVHRSDSNQGADYIIILFFFHFKLKI